MARRRLDKIHVINIPNAPRDQLQTNIILKLRAVPYLVKKSNDSFSFITSACSNTIKDLSSVLMGWMDLVKAIKYNKKNATGKSSRRIDGDRGILCKLET